MKKKLIIGAIVILLAALIVFAAVYGISCHKRKVIKSYAETVSTYFETVKEGNNLLMDVAELYAAYSGVFAFEEASYELTEDLGRCKGISYDVNKAYETVMTLEIKYDEMQKIKEAVTTHYEQYKVFEDKILNETKANYGEAYERIYKDWQKKFADEHNNLRKVLALYR